MENYQIGTFRSSSEISSAVLVLMCYKIIPVAVESFKIILEHIL